MNVQAWDPPPAMPAVDATISAEARALRTLAAVLGRAEAQEAVGDRQEGPLAAFRYRDAAVQAEAGMFIEP